MIEADDPDVAWATRLARARRAERMLIRLGWLVIAVSAFALIVEVLAMAYGYDDLADGLVVLSGIVLGGILAGAAAFGAGVNIGINAERLEREIARGAAGPRG